MKILSPLQIQQVDQETIATLPITSIDLMEKAAEAFAAKYISMFTTELPVHIFCGPGNNGGDGLAIARLLHKKKYNVTVYTLANAKKYSADYQYNQKRLERSKVEIHGIQKATELPSQPLSGVIIDALYGSGLNQPLKDIAKAVVESINLQPAIKISVDIPSGLFANTPTTEVAVQADYVFTFQLPKLSFLMPSNVAFIADWQILDIGLSPSAIDAQNSQYEYLTLSDIQAIFKKRNRFSHKGSYGHLLLIAGSEGKVGTAILAGKAALRAGVGLLSIYLPEKLVPNIQTALPEAMCVIASQKELKHQLKESTSFNVIAIGPGIGQEKGMVNLFKALLKLSKSPLVIDADALNLLSKHRELFEKLPSQSILTPHPGEFKRMVGEWKDDFHKLQLLQELAIKYNIIVVLKGAYTCICNSNGQCYFNSTGNSGMATGGSGDTLTGIIAGLLAQGYSPLHAAQLGVYVHGLAGDFAAETIHPNALIASDITEHLGQAFKRIDDVI
jgi:NAD(P)H-hydrate epimerase